MTRLALPDAPPSRRGLALSPRCDVSSSLMAADRRRAYRSHRARVMDREDEGYKGMEPRAVVDGTSVTVLIPGAFSRAPPDVLCELASHAFRRMNDPSLPMVGPTTFAHMSTDMFRRTRMWALGRVGDEKQVRAMLQRRSVPPGRLASLFYARMEQMAPFLAHLLEIRRARLVPLSGEASGEYDVYPDPYARVVLYDREVLDPLRRPLACLYAVYRSFVVMACFDRRRGELDGRRFMLLMSMCPWPEGEESCRDGGIRLQEFPFERRPMLP